MTHLMKVIKHDREALLLHYTRKYVPIYMLAINKFILVDKKNTSPQLGVHRTSDMLAILMDHS